MEKSEVKLCLLGETGVGKTSLALQFIHGRFNRHTLSNLSASYLTKTMIRDGKVVKFFIWDTAGQEKYQSMTPMYY
ncbi:small GTPase superfamily, Rab type, partial [Kipferlia bialata]|eukprot:g12637.t1